MDKKTECEIVQDLLLGYVDDVLNQESKKIVEKHLSECKVCQEKLKDIQQDIKTNEDSQKKQIDYLKKIRRRNIIKSIMIAIGIILFICLVVFLRKFIIVNEFMNKAKQSMESNNIYRETSQVVTEDSVAITKEWYKDGKYKMESEIYSKDGVIKWPTEYAIANSDERITIDHDNKKVIIENGEFTKLKNEEKNLKPVSAHRCRFIDKLNVVFNYSIYTSTYSIGREYYVMNKLFDKNSDYEVWIDKDNGLPLRTSGDGVIRTFFEGTNVTKEEIDMRREYKSEFGIVSDEDVSIPDYTGYEIEYKNTNL